MTETTSSSYFEALSYPTYLELRIIYSDDFDCLAYLSAQGFLCKKTSIKNSKKGNYHTCKTHIQFNSYQHYLEVRSTLSSHQSIHLIL